MKERPSDRLDGRWEREKRQRDIERGVGDERSEREQSGERESACWRKIAGKCGAASAINPLPTREGKTIPKSDEDTYIAEGVSRTSPYINVYIYNIYILYLLYI